MEKPTYQYATNATFPYQNDWSYHARKVSRTVTEREASRAREARTRREALQEARKVKAEFFTALVNKDSETAKSLLKKHPTLLERHTRYGQTPLMLAASVQDTPMVSHLLEMGADVLAKDGIGATALIMAAAKGATQIVELLLRSKQGGNAGRAYLLAQTTKGGETCVMAAAKGGHTDTLVSLMKASAPVTAVTVRGVNALMLACRHDRVECARVLMQEGGIRPTDTDIQGQTPLMYAAAAGAEGTLRFLLEHKPPLDLAQPDMQGLTAMDHACQGGHLKCADLLLSKGAKLSDGGDTGTRLLTIAAKAGQADMLTWLLSKGVGVDTLTTEGPHNPIFAAMRSGVPAAVEALLGAGVRLEVRDNKGRTPLAYAARHGLTPIVKLLVSKGADLLAVDNAGRVPRLIAHVHNHRDTSQVLSDIARSRLLVPDSKMERETPAVGPLVESALVWKPHMHIEVDTATLRTYQLHR